jgi:hypothetical protein
MLSWDGGGEVGGRSTGGTVGSIHQARMEAAAERALMGGAWRYQSVKSILKELAR